ncbi:MAG: hypothetical protein WCO00_16715 [Rhodospirillaceae bacterium]
MQATVTDVAMAGPRQRGESTSPTRGLVLGPSLSFHPPPPAQDVLGNPVLVTKLPAYELPHDSFATRFSWILSQIGLSSRARELRQLWRLQGATAVAVAAMAPSIARAVEKTGWLKRHNIRRSRAPTITHPYAVLDSFEAMMQAPDSLSKERRFLEIILALMLRQYVETISRANNNRFSFESEAREHFLRAVRLEHLLKKISIADERIPMLQQYYDSYYHCKNYYIFSLISREKTANEGKMFMMYCHAIHALSRFQADGTVSDRPSESRMPARSEVLFLFQRDRCLKKRCLESPEVRAQAKALVKSFHL